MNQKIGLVRRAQRGGVLLSFVSYVATIGATASIGAGALREGVEQYINIQKASAQQVCEARALVFDQVQQAEFIAGCARRSIARIDADVAGVRALVDSIQVL